MEKKTRVLIVEDEAMFALLLKRNLKLAGYEIGEPVSTGEVAIQKAGEEKPDVILMDMRLAGQIDGFEAARTIIARYHIPIIFMTGYIDDGMIAQAQALGVPYLVKPVTPVEIIPVIESLLQT